MDALSECEVTWGSDPQGGERKAILRAGMGQPNRWGEPKLGGPGGGLVCEAGEAKALIVDNAYTMIHFPVNLAMHKQLKSHTAQTTVQATS